MSAKCATLEFLVNIKTQHSELALTLEKLKSISLQDKDTRQYLFQLNVLIGHLSAHFATEEQIMLSFDYPMVIKHKQQHDDFISTTTSFSNDIAEGEITNLSEITKFIELWFEQHELGFDIALEKFLTNTTI